jgi:CheY-like chemotaxis protein
VENPEKKKVLVYESRINYAKSVCWSLENMKVPHTMAATQNEFAALLYREEWFYVFSGYGLYEKIKPFIEQSASVFCGGKKPRLALMVEWGAEVYNTNARFISIPIQSLSIANTLNGKADKQNYFESSGVIRHTFPNARLLIVDDIAANLKVAEGLLSPYNAKIDTCLSGAEAIGLVKQNKYDLIFMDHMMPEMDGIETTAIIRKLEKEQDSTSFIAGETRSDNGNLRQQIPIVALTANAVVGMREMFIEKGFNDFISKPVDVSKLDEILDRWIPKDKKTASNEQDKPPQKDTNSLFPDIPNVDTAKGIAMLRGNSALYMKVLSMFCKEADERLPHLQTIPEANTLPAFIIHIHSLKGVSASIGAQKISSYAAELEAAGKAADMAFIREHLPDFTLQLAKLGKNIRAVLLGVTE